jgi:hypothetical protein
MKVVELLQPSDPNHERPALPPSRSNLLLGGLGHGVESTAVLEPLDLRLVEGVLQGNVERRAVLGVHNEGDGLANGELGAKNINLYIANN